MEKMIGGSNGGKRRMHMINISALNISFNLVDKRGQGPDFWSSRACWIGDVEHCAVNDTPTWWE